MKRTRLLIFPSKCITYYLDAISAEAKTGNELALSLDNEFTVNRPTARSFRKGLSSWADEHGLGDEAAKLHRHKPLVQKMYYQLKDKIERQSLKVIEQFQGTITGINQNLQLHEEEFEEIDRAQEETKQHMIKKLVLDKTQKSVQNSIDPFQKKQLHKRRNQNVSDEERFEIRNIFLRVEGQRLTPEIVKKISCL